VIVQPDAKSAAAPSRNRRRAERGVVLAVVMVLLGVLLLWWGALFAYARTIVRVSASETARRQACWMARSGALHGLLALNDAARPTAPKRFPSVTPVEGFEYKVKFSARAGLVTITSEGRWDRVEQTRRWTVPWPRKR